MIFGHISYLWLTPVYLHFMLSIKRRYKYSEISYTQRKNLHLSQIHTNPPNCLWKKCNLCKRAWEEESHMFHYYFVMFAIHPFGAMLQLFNDTSGTWYNGHTKIPIDVFQRNSTERYMHTIPILLLHNTILARIN